MSSARRKPLFYWISLATGPLAVAGIIVGLAAGASTAGRWTVLAISAVVLVMVGSAMALFLRDR